MVWQGPKIFFDFIVNVAADFTSVVLAAPSLAWGTTTDVKSAATFTRRFLENALGGAKTSM